MKIKKYIENKIKNNFILGFLAIGIIFSVLGYLRLEFNFLSCQTNGCNFASEIIKIDSKYLYLASFIFFFFNFYIYFYKTIFEKIKKEIFFSGLIFEFILFFTMFFSYGEFCKECFKMILILFILGILIDFKKNIFVLSIIFSLFLLNPINKNIPLKNGLTLIKKDNCPHCKNVEQFITKNSVKATEINVKNELELLKTLKIKSVPVLIKKEDNSIRIINGDKNIILFLNGKTILDKKYEKKEFPFQENMLFLEEGENEGCMIKNTNCD